VTALYSTDILRAAVACADFPLLTAPTLRLEGRTPVCGSRLVLDLMLDDMSDPIVQAVGLSVHACAVGQAAAALFARGVVGRSIGSLAATAAALETWLTQPGASAPDWPGIDLLEPVRAYPARHAALTLAFRLAAEVASVRAHAA
jgi:NifU-like protein involved in Fe-S cluster formation